MSAHCQKHGCDIVYPPGTWPLGECPECVLEERLRISYPMTPVDCLISELRDLLELGQLHRASFEARVSQFKDEVAS